MVGTRNICLCIAVFLLVGFHSCNKEDYQTETTFNVEDCSDCIPFSELKDKYEFYEPILLWFNFPKDSILGLWVNNNEISFNDTIEIRESGFYKMELKLKDSIINKRVVIIDEVRGDSEWGLKPWTPQEIVLTEQLIGEVVVVHPNNVLAGVACPVAVFTKSGNKIVPNYSIIKHDLHNDEKLKRGVGSIQIPTNSNKNSYSLSINGNNKPIDLKYFDESECIILRDTIFKDSVIPKNSCVKIIENLVIVEDANLSINSGVCVLVDEAVNIYNYGKINISANNANPTIFTSADPNKFWGGIISSGSNSSINASSTFFCKSCFYKGGIFNLGHANCQALFQLVKSTIKLNNCYILDHQGQVFFSEFSSLFLDNLLIQRCKTGGQINNSTAIISNCVFTDFPNDKLKYSDDDNDALYLAENCNVTISNCTFMYANDDGLDSGSASGGKIEIYNSHFEACFHEGAALSSYNGLRKSHYFNSCVFKNCGQGLELGFSSATHIVFAENCLFKDNYIGIRYGDNYTFKDANGKLTVKNSLSINNFIDLWNMTRTEWEARIENTEFENLLLSKKSTQYPEIEIIKP